MDFYGALRAAQKETFRLEMLDQYLVDDEREDFAAWKRGEQVDPSPGMVAWVSDLEKLRERGVVTHRVHVVTLPLSEYMRYEIDAYKITKETVNFIERTDYEKLKKPFQPKEFWLIDERHIFVQNYDSEGHWLGSDYIGGREEAKRHARMKGLLLSKALPLDEFAKKNSIDL